MDDIREQSMPPRNPKRDFSIVGLAYFCFLAMSIATQFLVVLIIKILPFTASQEMAYLLNMIAAYVIAAPTCYLIFKRIPVQQKVTGEQWGLWKILLHLLIAVGLLYWGSMTTQFLISISKVSWENPLNDLIINASMLFRLAIVVVIAPIVEELLFRKILIDRIGFYGQGIAVFISAITFGLFHGNFYQVLYASLLGMVFAYVYVKTNRISYCIIFHIVINFLGSVVSLWLMNGIDLKALQSNDMNAIMVMAPRLLLMMGYVVVVIGSMIASVVLLICFRKRITFEPGVIRILKGQRFKTVFINLGMILFILGCGCLFYFSMKG